MTRIHLIALVALIMTGCGDKPSESVKQADKPVLMDQPSVAVKLKSKPVWGDVVTQEINTGGDCHIDVINDKPGEGIKNISAKSGSQLKVAGWGAISAKEGVIASNIEIALKSKSIDGARLFATTSNVKRQDLADHFKNSTLINSGFVVVANLGDALPGNYVLEMIQHKDGKNYKCAQTVDVILEK